MKDRKNKIFNLILVLVPFACILLLWGVVAKSVDNQVLLPSVSNTFKEFFSLFTYSEFYLAFFGTLLRAFVAFICSFIIAFVLAFISVRFDRAKFIVSPIIAVLRALPTIAVVLLLLVWTNSQVAPVIVTMIVVLPTLFTGIKSALSNVDKEQLEMCKLFKVERKKVLFKVYIPQVLPDMLICVGSGLSLNVKLMVAAEVIAYTSNSIGNFLSLTNYYDATAKMMALVLCMIIVGLLIEGLFSTISKRVGRWKK